MTDVTCPRCGNEVPEEDMARCCPFLPKGAERSWVDEEICAGCHDEIVDEASGPAWTGSRLETEGVLDEYYKWLEED